MTILNKKTILLIAPEFFHCDRHIENELKRRGAIVLRMIDRPFQNAFFKLVCRLAPNLVSYLLIPYYYAKIRKLRGKVDYLFVINGQTLHHKLLKKIKKLFAPKSMILYMWDSLENRPSVTKSLHLYDRALSFDPMSCKEYAMEFRPLFFVQNKREDQDVKKKFDLAFIGTAHTDRYVVLSRIFSEYPEKKFYSYLFLQSKLVYIVLRYLRFKYQGASIGTFRYTPLGAKQVTHILNGSDVLLDIEHPKQRGLTIRNIEYLNMNKKLLQQIIQLKSMIFINLEIF